MPDLPAKSPPLKDLLAQTWQVKCRNVDGSIASEADVVIFLYYLIISSFTTAENIWIAILHLVSSFPSLTRTAAFYCVNPIYHDLISNTLSLNLNSSFFAILRSMFSYDSWVFKVEIDGSKYLVFYREAINNLATIWRLQGDHSPFDLVTFCTKFINCDVKLWKNDQSFSNSSVPDSIIQYTTWCFNNHDLEIDLPQEFSFFSGSPGAIFPAPPLSSASIPPPLSAATVLASPALQPPAPQPPALHPHALAPATLVSASPAPLDNPQLQQMMNALSLLCNSQSMMMQSHNDRVNDKIAYSKHIISSFIVK